MSKQKICILTSVHPVFDTRIFYKEAKTLANAGYDVTLIAQHNKDEAVDGIKIIALPKPKNRFERFFKTDYLVYKKALKQKADIYHFHDPELVPWIMVLKLKTKARIIYDIHENVVGQILAKEWLPRVLRYPIAYVYNFFENLAIKFFDIIIAAGDDIKPRNSKIITIKNYPFRTMATESVPASKNTTEEFHCIYIGGVSKDRCIKEMLQSLDYINNSVLFTIIGPYEDERYLQDLKNLIKIQKRHRVKLIAPLPHQKTMECLKSAKVGFVLFKPNPNNITAVSRNNKLYEYMAVGLPVVASNFPLWREVVEGNNCGICVNPLEPKEIARAIEYLIEHPAAARKMGENGRKAVLEKYNWENESKKLLEVYEKLSR